MLDFDNVLCYLSKCMQEGVASSQINMDCLLFSAFQRGGESDGFQGPDCLLNFLPLRQITRDHADHPSCWVCVLPRPFPSIQTMPEVHPSTKME